MHHVQQTGGRRQADGMRRDLSDRCNAVWRPRHVIGRSQEAYSRQSRYVSPPHLWRNRGWRNIGHGAVAYSRLHTPVRNHAGWHLLDHPSPRRRRGSGSERERIQRRCPMTIPRVRFTFWKAVFAAIMVAGIYCTFIRFYRGLGASTNLSDQFPWGLWIGFDVMCGVMLAAGGFTLTAAVEIFNIKRFHSIIRPTILAAFLGYVLVCAALMYDLGLPWNIWHPLIMRNPHSVMFEVAYCVMF